MGAICADLYPQQESGKKSQERKKLSVRSHKRNNIDEYPTNSQNDLKDTHIDGLKNSETIEKHKQSIYHQRTHQKIQVKPTLKRCLEPQNIEDHSSLQRKIEELEGIGEENRRKIKELQITLKQKTLFTGQILDQIQQEKMFLIQSIENHMKKTIKKTKLLYNSEKDLIVPFHERIDGKSNLIIIVKTQNALFAGYYSGTYAQDSIMTDEGLLISLNNRKVYCLNNLANNPKKNKIDTKPIYGMVYDEFYLIFGNSEIRVKPGEKEGKVFSNFGVCFSSQFNSEGDYVDSLLCEGKSNEVGIVSYQIYEAILSEI